MRSFTFGLTNPSPRLHYTMLTAASETTKVIKNTTYSYTYYVTTIKSTIMYYTNYNMYCLLSSNRFTIYLVDEKEREREGGS